MSAVNIIETNWRWNGSLSNRARTDYIALHHAEASSCTAEQVDQWHKENGWSGIGYHFFVRKDGRIYRGRPINKMGAHVSGMNNCSIVICAEGKYSTETMPETQKIAICRLLVYLKDNYYPNAKIVGHKEIGDSDCPGRNYPLADIKNNYRAYAGEKEADEVTKAEFDALAARVEKLEKNQDTMIYNYIDNNMPSWAHEAVKWCADKGIIQGTGEGLGLSNTKLWVYGVNEGSFCSNCCNLVSDYVSGKKYSGAICKCIAYGEDRTKETDWRRNYTGCGMYNMPFYDMNKEPLYKKFRKTRSDF